MESKLPRFETVTIQLIQLNKDLKGSLVYSSSLLFQKICTIDCFYDSFEFPPFLLLLGNQEDFLVCWCWQYIRIEDLFFAWRDIAATVLQGGIKFVLLFANFINYVYPIFSFLQKFRKSLNLHLCSTVWSVKCLRRRN